MLLASIIILFSLLALALLALLDRCDAAMLKAQAERRRSKAQPVAYYDAFADRRQRSRSAREGGVERRKTAA